MASFGDAGAVDHLAAIYRSVARELEALGRRCVQELDAADFEGPAANRLRDSAHGRLGQLMTEADRLGYLANLLNQHAEWIREQERLAAMAGA